MSCVFLFGLLRLQKRVPSLWGATATARPRETILLILGYPKKTSALKNGKPIRGTHPHAPTHPRFPVPHSKLRDNTAMAKRDRPPGNIPPCLDNKEKNKKKTLRKQDLIVATRDRSPRNVPPPFLTRKKNVPLFLTRNVDKKKTC